MKTPAAAVLAALALAACDPQPMPPAAAVEPPVAAAEPEPDACAHVGDLYDLYASGGWAEDDALDDLRAREEYALGYVVDGVFAKGAFAAGEPGGIANRVEVLKTCRRLANGRAIY